MTPLVGRISLPALCHLLIFFLVFALNEFSVVKSFSSLQIVAFIGRGLIFAYSTFAGVTFPPRVA